MPDSTKGLLFIIPWELHHPGGVNQVVTNLFHQAEKSGHWHPMIGVNTWESKKPRYLKIEGRATICFRLRSPWNMNNPVTGFLAFLFYLPSSLSMFRRILAKDRIAIVNIHYPSLSALLFIPLKMLGCFKGTFILSFHGLDIENGLLTRNIERWLWQRLLDSADTITTCSSALKQRVVELSPKCQQKVRVIHNGLDIEYVQSHRDMQYHLEPELYNRTYILNVATFEHKKGQDILLDAFRQISSEFPYLALVLIGRNGPALEQLTEQASHPKFINRVFFYENIPHSKVAVFFEHAKLFCLPSRSEPFGIVLLEAGLFSLPVVATRVGGVPEIIMDGQNGRLVAPDDPAALAAALRQMLINEETAISMGGNLRDDVIQNFTWERAFHEYERID